MFGTHFNHQKIQKNIQVFGALFNNIYITRPNVSGNVENTKRVPISYGPRKKFIERINEHPDLTENTRTAIDLPRMAFEIIGYNYDPTAQAPKTNKLCFTKSDGSKGQLFAGTPYVLTFQLSILVRTHYDGTQIVEQILPFFNPDYTATFRPFADAPSFKEDVPLTLMSMNVEDNYENTLDARRTIIYTLTFDMKTRFYGPMSEGGSIIRDVKVDYGLIQQNSEGVDSCQKTTRIQTLPNPIDAEPSDDYTFTQYWFNLADSDSG